MPEFLTLEGRSKIKTQLGELKEKRPKIAKRIRDAKEMGDLSENTEFTTAKDEQSWVESEINRLENLLKSAETIDNTKNSDKVRIGSSVQLKSKEGIKDYMIVGSEESDPSQGRISHESPLGKELINKKIGDNIEIQTPNGKIIFKIVSFK